MEALKHRIMVVDCQLSGISGDMALGALLGAGADEAKVRNAIESIKSHAQWCREIKFYVKDVARKGITVKQVKIEIEEKPAEKGEGRLASEIRSAVSETIDDLELSQHANEFALKVIDTLTEAERKVHGKIDGSEIRLGELGSTDTVADAVGVAAALDDLKVFTDAIVYSTPVAVGGGLYEFSHGVYQSPGPVALEILRKFSFPMLGGPVEGELLTPTGASILANLVNGKAGRFYPDMKPSAVGYGAGRRDLGEVPNMLRIVMGIPVDYGLLADRIFVLETNLDDVSGEVIGFLMERLLSEGAKDVSVVPVIMKKNRPGQILKVMVGENDVEKISRVIVDETGSLGVRTYPVNRFVVSRDVVSIEAQIYGLIRTVRVKVARSKSGEIINLKPEYEDVRSISIDLNKPFREVEEIVKMEARRKMAERRAEES